MPAENAATIFKPLVLISHSSQHLSRTVQQVTDHRLHNSPLVRIAILLSSNSSILPLHLPSLLPYLIFTRVKSNHHLEGNLFWLSNASPFQFLHAMVPFLAVRILCDEANNFLVKKYDSLQAEVNLCPLIDLKIRFFHLSFSVC